MESLVLVILRRTRDLYLRGPLPHLRSTRGCSPFNRRRKEHRRPHPLPRVSPGMIYGRCFITGLDLGGLNLISLKSFLHSSERQAFQRYKIFLGCLRRKRRVFRKDSLVQDCLFILGRSPPHGSRLGFGVDWTGVIFCLL